jgi:threonine/homoserine/homoserine lactone efflux protein
MIAFLGVAALLIVTPGPDTALTIRNALRGGRRAGVLTAAGVASGQAVWALFTAAGVAAILRASQPAFTALRLAGAAYLLWLGIQSLAGAFRRGEDAPVREQPDRASYRQGLLSNLSNPKMVVFFVTLLPQFAATSFVPMLALGLVFAVMTVLWLSAYAVAVAKAGEALGGRWLRRVVDGLAGIVMIGLAGRLAGERR